MVVKLLHTDSTETKNINLPFLDNAIYKGVKNEQLYFLAFWP